jgi:hypothetical protein
MPGDPEVHRSWRSWAPWKAECGNWLSCWGQKKDDTDSIQRVRTAIFWFFLTMKMGAQPPLNKPIWRWLVFGKPSGPGLDTLNPWSMGYATFILKTPWVRNSELGIAWGRKFSIQPISERCINGVNGVYFSETLLSRSHHWGPPQGRRWLGWEPGWTTGRPGRYRKGPVSHSQEDLEFLLSQMKNRKVTRGAREWTKKCAIWVCP